MLTIPTLFITLTGLYLSLSTSNVNVWVAIVLVAVVICVIAMLVKTLGVSQRRNEQRALSYKNKIIKEKFNHGKKPLVYFLCTGNSCRSQIADGFLKALGSDKYEVESAGLGAHGLNPRAVQVMNEAGVDISSHSSNVIDPEVLNRADYVITLCGHADEHCPVISNKNIAKWHWGFDDPAKATGSEEEVMNKFRDVRDSIKNRIEQFVKEGTLHD